MSRKSLFASATLPVLGLAVLIAHAEWSSRGDEWRVPVSGYDPRDPISGQYVRYTFAWQWSEPPTCEQAPVRSTPTNCCVCLRPGPAGRVDPRATRVHCEQTAECADVIFADETVGPQKFFVPEEHASTLEKLLLKRPAHVGLVVRDGKILVRELYLDGRPWRELVR